MPIEGAVWDPASAADPGLRTGTYINVEPNPVAPPALTAFGTVLIVGTADWGPLGTPIEIRNEAEVTKYLGSDDTSPAVIATREALRQGPSLVLFHRISLASADEKASKTLNDSLSAACLTVTAKYEGVFGNTIKVEVVDNPTAGSKDLRIYVGSQRREVWSGADAEAIAAAAVDSNLVDVAATGTAGRDPVNIAATALTGGDNGTSVTSTEFTAALDEIGAYDFRTFALLTSDTSIQQSTRTWAASKRAGGKRIVYFAGSALAETFSNRLSQVQALNSESTAYVVTDYTTTDGVAVPAYVGAAVIAALYARYGTESVTFKAVEGAATVTNPIDEDDWSDALTYGMVAFSEYDGEVVVEQGLTSLQPASQVAPLSTDYRKLRYVAIVDLLASRIAKRLNRKFHGKVENDAGGRAEGVRMVQAELDLAMGERLLIRGLNEFGEDVTARAFEDPRYTSTKDRVYVAVSGQAIDAIEKMFLSIRI
jgi:hypothetical protein